MERNMKLLRKAYLLLLILTLTACASNEELFAKYDAYCQGTTCVSTEVEVVYEQVPAEVLSWEPAVYFGYDLDALEESEAARLDKNIKLLELDSDLGISLQAFTDSVASFAYNVNLSERRRITVVNYLMEAGIAEERIVSSAGSETLPVLPSDEAEDRILNRRVEMMLLDSSGRPISFGVVLPNDQEDFVPPYPAVKVQ